MTEIEHLSSKVDRLLVMVTEALTPKQPSLTAVDFARLSGLSRDTVHRKIKDGQIIKQKGRIPYSELRKFLS